MKKKFLAVCFALCGFAAFARDLPKVAVANFDVQGGIKPDEAKIITELFTMELVSKGAIKVVDRTSFDKIIAEMKFQTSDWSNSEKTAALGRAINAGYVIRGQLMKMGAVIYWTASMIDLNTTEVLSSALEQISDLGEVFNKLPSFCAQMMNKPPLGYSAGDRGPGGGIVFLSEGDAYMECSEILGSFTWDQAKTAAKNFKGGRYTDWRLPTAEELNLMYVNLRKRNLGGMGDNDYWSSSELNYYIAYYQRFSDGNRNNNNKNNTYCVRAVQGFTQRHLRIVQRNWLYLSFWAIRFFKVMHYAA
jgi:TolB-like protein